MKKNLSKAVKKSAGIYQIKNLINGKTYIGMTTGFAARYSQHISCLSKGIHRNQILQQAFAKHGTYAFAFDVLEVVERLPGEELNSFKKRLFDIEYDHIIKAQSANRDGGYNMESDPRQPNNLEGQDLVFVYGQRADEVLPNPKRHEIFYCKKLTVESAKEIRILLTRGIAVNLVANHFGLSKSMVGQLRTMVVWKNTFPTQSEIDAYIIPDSIDSLVSTSPVRVREIKFLRYKGCSISGINKFYNQTITGAISRGTTYTEIALTQADIKHFESTDLYKRFELFNKARIASGRAASTAGAKRAQSKLKPSEIEQIALLLRQGVSCPEIVRQLALAVDKSQIERIRSGKTWSEISGIKPGDFPKGAAANLAGESHLSAKLKTEQVRQIKQSLAEGVQKATLSRQFNVSRATIRAIESGRSWKNI